MPAASRRGCSRSTRRSASASAPSCSCCALQLARATRPAARRRASAPRCCSCSARSSASSPATTRSQPMMEAARRGEGGPSFAVLHGVASAFFVAQVRRRRCARVAAGRAPRPARRRRYGCCADFLTLVGRRRVARFSVPPAASRMLPTTVTFLTCGRWLPLFENLSTLTTFGPGHAAFLLDLLLRRRRAPEHEQLADVLDRRGAERVAQLGEERLARGAVVGEDAHLDQAVGVERRVDLAAARRASRRRGRSRRPGRGDAPRRAFACARRR